MTDINDSDEFLELMDILHALPRDKVIVPANSGYNVGCNDWTGEMIYQKALSLLDAESPAETANDIMSRIAQNLYIPTEPANNPPEMRTCSVPTCRAEMRPGLRCSSPHCGLKE